MTKDRKTRMLYGIPWLSFSVPFIFSMISYFLLLKTSWISSKFYWILFAIICLNCIINFICNIGLNKPRGDDDEYSSYINVQLSFFIINIIVLSVTIFKLLCDRKHDIVINVPYNEQSISILDDLTDPDNKQSARKYNDILSTQRQEERKENVDAFIDRQQKAEAFAEIIRQREKEIKKGEAEVEKGFIQLGKEKQIKAKAKADAAKKAYLEAAYLKAQAAKQAEAANEKYQLERRPDGISGYAENVSMVDKSSHSKSEIPHPLEEIREAEQNSNENLENSMVFGPF